ncbi:prostamide/prostaglandin F synthase, partial [Tanacetum coccineum]
YKYTNWIASLYADPERMAKVLPKTIFEVLQKATENEAIEVTPDDRESVLLQGWLFVFTGKELLYAWKYKGKHVEHQDDNNLATVTKEAKKLGTFLNTIKRILDVLHCRTPMVSRRLTFDEVMPYTKAVVSYYFKDREPNTGQVVFKEMIICPPIEDILKPFEAELKLAR